LVLNPARTIIVFLSTPWSHW